MIIDQICQYRVIKKESQQLDFPPRKCLSKRVFPLSGGSAFNLTRVRLVKKSCFNINFPRRIFLFFWGLVRRWVASCLPPTLVSLENREDLLSFGKRKNKILWQWRKRKFGFSLWLRISTSLTIDKKSKFLSFLEIFLFIWWSRQTSIKIDYFQLMALAIYSWSRWNFSIEVREKFTFNDKLNFYEVYKNL